MERAVLPCVLDVDVGVKAEADATIDRMEKAQESFIVVDYC